MPVYEGEGLPSVRDVVVEDEAHDFHPCGDFVRWACCCLGAAVVDWAVKEDSEGGAEGCSAGSGEACADDAEFGAGLGGGGGLAHFDAVGC